MNSAERPKKQTKPLVRSDHPTLPSVLLELLNSRTQAEVADMLGVSQPSIYAYLRGVGPKSRPRRKTARQMAARLGVDVEWFCGLTAKDNKSA